MFVNVGMPACVCVCVCAHSPVLLAGAPQPVTCGFVFIRTTQEPSNMMTPMESDEVL